MPTHSPKDSSTSWIRRDLFPASLIAMIRLNFITLAVWILEKACIIILASSLPEQYDQSCRGPRSLIINSDDGGGIKVWNIESHKLVKAWTDGGMFPVLPSRRTIGSLWLVVSPGGFTQRKGNESTSSRCKILFGPCLRSLPTETNSHVTLKMTSASMTSRLAHPSSVH